MIVCSNSRVSEGSLAFSLASNTPWFSPFPLNFRVGPIHITSDSGFEVDKPSMCNVFIIYSPYKSSAVLALAEKRMAIFPTDVYLLRYKLITEQDIIFVT